MKGCASLDWVLTVFKPKILSSYSRMNELIFAIKILVMLTAYHFMKSLGLNGETMPGFFQEWWNALVN